VHPVDDVLAAPFAPLDDADGARIARERWGLEPVEVRRLETERDDTFRIDTADGRAVLKVANPADPPDVVDLQCAVLEHIASADPSIPVPRLRRTSAGERWARVAGAEDEERIARVLSWVPGSTLDYARTSSDDRRALGSLLARLSIAMSSFDHPGAGRVLAWDLQRLGGLRPQLGHIADPSTRGIVAEELDRFDAVVAPALRDVRHQVVHNDANMDNVVVDDAGRPYGVLDFGDMVRTAVVADLAVAMAYAVPSIDQLRDPALDPWATAYDVAAGYVAVRPLDAHEVALLPLLVLGRMAQRMLVNSWLAAENPSNAHHTLRANGHAAAALPRLRATDPPSLEVTA
jgi:Ser/Thr protein kinase RdoA (MazF antagonist)